MEVTADSMKFQNVLKKGVFTIPDYQRPFDWEETEISEFLEDIKKNIDKEYFIGHMVFEGNKDDNHFYIIDGQQRFTTITILLCVIRDIFDFIHKNDKLRDGLNDGFIYGKDADSEIFPILETDIPYPTFQDYVQAPPQGNTNKENLINKNINEINISINNSSELKIIYAYKFFYNSLKDFSEHDLINLRRAILNLEIIFVAVKGRVNAHSIFMTLNAKGKDLTFIDLIKNDIFSKYKNPNPARPKYLEEKWKEISSNFGQRGEEFFLAVWKSRYALSMNAEKIYKNYVEMTKQPEFDIVLFVEELYNDSIIFSKISNPQKIDWENSNIPKNLMIYFHLNNIIKVFGVTLSYPFLMSLLRAYSNKKVSVDFVLKTLKVLERFLFINNAICANGLSGFNKLFPSYAIKLFNTKDKTKVHAELRIFQQDILSRIPSFEEFNLKFSEKVYYLRESKKEKDIEARKMVQYCLNELERKAQNNNVIFNNLSIEHLFSVSKIDKKLFTEEIVKSLGNLVLLDADLNSRLNNKEYKAKRSTILNETSLITTREVVGNHEDWHIDDIKNRNLNLINEMYYLNK